MLTTNHMPLVQRQGTDLAAGVPEGYRRDLLRRSRSGDSEAFARLFDFYAERVFDYMYFHVGDEPAAEDLTARVFLKAWRNIPCYQPDREPFSVWPYLMARQAVIDYSRSQQGTSLVKEILSPADEGLEAYKLSEPCTNEGILG